MPRHLFTTEQFLQLIANDNSAWANSELIKGAIHDQHDEGVFHDEAVRLVYEALAEQRPDLLVRTRTRLQLGEHSVIPDVMAFQTHRTPGAIRLPGDTPGPLQLIVEVVGTTWAVDLDDKLKIYAQAQIPEYWVLDPEERVLQKYSRPAGGGREHFREMRRVAFADVLARMD